MNSMFETLLQLPLFQGMTQEDLTRILGIVKLHFRKYKAGETIIKSGTVCDRFEFILHGEVDAATTSPHAAYTFHEYFHAPHVVEPYSMFGMYTQYTANYVAVTEVHTVSISKSFILNELFNYEIFRFNYTNQLCNRSQQLSKRLWKQPSDQLEKRIIQFIIHHVERPADRKSIKIKMEELAKLLNSTRLSVSKALNELEAQGQLELNRGEIVVPDAKVFFS